jgi:hypothetical protein
VRQREGIQTYIFPECRGLPREELHVSLRVIREIKNLSIYLSPGRGGRRPGQRTGPVRGKCGGATPAAGESGARGGIVPGPQPGGTCSATRASPEPARGRPGVGSGAAREECSQLSPEDVEEARRGAMRRAARGAGESRKCLRRPESLQVGYRKIAWAPHCEGVEKSTIGAWRAPTCPRARFESPDEVFKRLGGLMLEKTALGHKYWCVGPSRQGVPGCLYPWRSLVPVGSYIDLAAGVRAFGGVFLCRRVILAAPVLVICVSSRL